MMQQVERTLNHNNENNNKIAITANAISMIPNAISMIPSSKKKDQMTFSRETTLPIVLTQCAEIVARVETELKKNLEKKHN